ncbi:RNA ligase family protein [Streptomyces sp. TRM76323]|uniref:RNA ligase family protein n=1 Tax=Streptomyces tamarix TaxID=3078565 RepID=A0ABU3QKY9_9ACTN|nr:RNA ligase family protein [Streptomyces tamarix]MDT9683436.1 RNA ligase family protein [Streptomyces tamarix]
MNLTPKQYKKFLSIINPDTTSEEYKNKVKELAKSFHEARENNNLANKIKHDKLGKRLFKKYPSLTNHYKVPKDRYLRNFLQEGTPLGSTLFYATEKVDGTNISVNIDTNTGKYIFAGRNRFLDENDSEKLYLDLPKILTDEVVNEMIDKLKQLGFDNDVVHIYGELYGFKIQKQNYNISENHERSVVLYDILVNQGANEYLHLNLHDLLMVVPQELLPHLIDSGLQTLSKWLENEPYEESFYGGINEGFVFKPAKRHVYYENKQSYLGVKYKTDKYLEVKKVKAPKKSQYEVNNPELVSDIERYITVNRVMNLVSHGGITLEFKNFGALVKELAEDVYKEYIRDESESEIMKKYTFDDIHEATFKTLNKQMSTTVREAIQS